MSSSSKMPIYRPVSHRLWDDARFLSCSDDGRMMWLYLLTCPALPIPGVVIGGEGTMSERLGWDVERVRIAYAEVVAAGINVRREGRVVWCVNALKHQPCAGPNAIKSWGRIWGDIPDVSFKRELWQVLRIASKRWSRVFDQQMPEPFREPVPEGVPPRVGPHKHQHKQEHQHEHKHNPEREDEAPELSLSGLPDGWEPDDSPDLAAAIADQVKRGVDVARELAKFKAHVRADGARKHDWNAAWLKWLLQARPPTAKELDALREAERRVRSEERRQAERKDPRPATLAIVRDVVEPNGISAWEEAQRIARGGKP